MVKGKKTKTIKKNARAVRHPIGTRLRVKDSYGCYTGTVVRKSDDKEGYVHISYDARSGSSDAISCVTSESKDASSVSAAVRRLAKEEAREAKEKAAAARREAGAWERGLNSNRAPDSLLLSTI